MPTELSGLTSTQVAERVSSGQVNHLPSRSGRSTAGIVRANVLTRVNAILFVLFCLVLVTGNLLQGAFGLLIIANSVVGIVQELRAKRMLDNLAVVGEAHPIVVRDGERTRVTRDEVVLDDLIAVGPGEQIVVDGSVVAADYLEVDESLLTGEADPVAKQPGDGVLSGAYVISGTGLYRAERVGADAYAAQLTAQAAKFTLVSSELRQGINRILRWVTYLLVPVAALSIFVQFNQPDTTWQESVLRMVAVLVPMVPEGLVLLTSMAFALGVIRLGRRQCLVNELPAIEGLARVDVVCADKTGTLTQHAMTLGELLDLTDDPGHTRVVLSQLVAADDAPNASVQAIAAAIAAADDPWPVEARAPFTSARKWSGVSFAGERGHWVLGAPEVLAGHDELARRAEQIGATGRRVLLLARAKQRVDSPQAPGEASPVALLVLDQLIRPDAAETLAYFQEQGVALKVISGDNAASVAAVTRSLGVAIGDVIDARTLPGAGEQFDDAVDAVDVFGRVTPEQKRQMVGALQGRGHTVAMTGDGVNDVLALKDADLGVAMGSGAPATRAVAQIVLLDDKFATLPHVVAEGRRVIGNVERVAKLFLTKTVYAIALALVLGLMGLPNPFLPLQMTVVGWFTIGIPAFLLSLAPNRERARPGFVWRTLSVAIPCGLIVAGVTIATYVTARGFGVVPDPHQEQASTATLIALILTATWVLAVVARPYYWWRVGLVAFAYAFYFLVFALPSPRRALGLDITNTAEITFGVVAGLIGMALVELTWWVTKIVRRERADVWAQPKAALP
ncbi:HAD-IC family P-type ATPase [Tessaracoccus sp. ZS01]|uniref:HAD-IC family P-type ATPase n=1 Tax=Tessaracoccus sp. ZS01 TaxID=1906324 RepID=UPI00096D115F|nr:HAD-IC family P-type ATPase [Tessaracoccus sp. ZS01]MCG6566157.1 magnesium-transporting ATPase [Tessaracoccus sp. ZS01]OMG58650.1 magnesium-transporting ATPase [Tessaracoccus sp. ZS01]